MLSKLESISRLYWAVIVFQTEREREYRLRSYSIVVDNEMIGMAIHPARANDLQTVSLQRTFSLHYHRTRQGMRGLVLNSGAGWVRVPGS